MNEKKEKVKKKKMVKAEDGDDSAKTPTNGVEDGQMWNASVENREKRPDMNKTVVDAGKYKHEKTSNERTKRKPVPEDFYVAYPKSIKKATDHFQDVHSRKMAELLEAFHLFDFDRDGIINHDDLRKTFASLNRPDVSDEEIDQMLQEGLHPLNFDAFVILLGYKTLDLDPEEVVLDGLSNWDNERSGLISQDRLMHDIMALGDKFTEDEAKAALADAPIVLSKKKERMIDYVQFSEDLCGLRKMMQRRPTIKEEH